MELRMHSHHWEQRWPDWPIAAVSGFAAGAAIMVLELLWAALTGDSPWRTSNMIAAIVFGPDALQAGPVFSLPLVATALLTHYLLGVVFGLILAAIIMPFRLDSSLRMVLAAGAVFGALLYMVNFYGMVMFFSWFAEMRGWAALIAHMIFGMTAAVIYRRLEHGD